MCTEWRQRKQIYHSTFSVCGPHLPYLNKKAGYLHHLATGMPPPLSPVKEPLSWLQSRHGECNRGTLVGHTRFGWRKDCVSKSIIGKLKTYYIQNKRTEVPCPRHSYAADHPIFFGIFPATQSERLSDNKTLTQINPTVKVVIYLNAHST